MTKYQLMVDYADQQGISGLLECIERGALPELSGAEAGGWGSLLNQARLSARTVQPNEEGARWTSTPVETWGRLARIIEAMKVSKSANYFESLDEAFAAAPAADDGCAWVYTTDRFTVTNLGGGGGNLQRDPPFRKLEGEQRFVFDIDPLRTSYVERDDYFKKPKRRWHLTMVASLWRCPRLSWRQSWEWSNESIYFHWHHFIDIPLNVFGAYLKSGLQTMIIPYAIWA